LARKRDKGSAIAAFLIAPGATVFLVVIPFISSYGGNYWLAFLLNGLVVAYASAFILGIPAYFLLRSLAKDEKRLFLITILTAAIISGLLPTVLYLIFPDAYPDAGLFKIPDVIVFATLTGAIAGVIFWLVYSFWSIDRNSGGD
jgi:hypothetical protein